MAALPAMAEDDGDEWDEAPMQSSPCMGQPCIMGHPGMGQPCMPGQSGMAAPGAKRPAPGMGRGWDALNLTAEQKTKIQALRDSFLQQRSNERQQIRHAIDKVRALSKDPATTDADLTAAIQAKHELLIQAELAHLQHWRDVRKLLTPEQLQQLDSRREQRRNRMEEGGQPPRR